jgi:hypothetical protein
LDEILPNNLIFRTSSNSLILLQKSTTELKKTEIIIKGNVYESISANAIAKATVLSINSSQAALTDVTGNFKLLVTNRQKNVLLSVTKLGYRDTTFVLQPKSQSISIKISRNEIRKDIPILSIVELRVKPVESYPISKFIIPSQLVTNAQNITGYSTKKIQLALTPGLSTNLKIAGTVKNDVSINLIGGYSYGNNFLELGGAFNINRTNVNGLQMAGLSNLVGNNVNGWQIAGAINRTKGHQRGLQSSGFGNFNSNSFSGLQLSGAVNVAKNISGAQLAGAVNVADSINGLQMTTVFNKCTTLKGLQFSVTVNLCDTLNGSQIGVLNKAKHNNGLQIGVINFINTSEGASIGLINFIKGKKLPRILFVYRKKNKINFKKQ